VRIRSVLQSVVDAASGRSPRADGSPRRRRRADATEPRFEYAPELDGHADPGEVVWAWVPYEDDPSQGKDRPVLIVGRAGAELLGVPMTSKHHARRRDEDQWVDIGTRGWDSQRRPSEANAGRLLRLAPAEVRREGAVLARARFDEVLAKVRQLHDAV
jgi:hypothetical protein